MTHLLVLTAAPGMGLSDEQLAGATQDVQALGEPRWLGPDAAEIPVGNPVVLTLPGIDANCVPAANRRKQLLIADMDSTMITVECIDEVAAVAGVGAQVQAITEPAMRGEISFEDALRARVALMAGFPAHRLQHVYDERVAFMPGGRTLVRTMAANGAHCALVSGGFTFFTERVSTFLGFHENRANGLQIANGALTGAVDEPILGRAAKLEALKEISTALSLSPEDALAVGDGANDLAMIGAAGLGVAFRAKPVVAEAADVSIVHGDLTALLYLQGYAASAFVTD